MLLSIFHHLIPPLLFVCVCNAASSIPPPRGFQINCGATEEITIGGIKWITDDGFITTGNRSEIETPGLQPILATVRYFPDESARKYCYVIPVSEGEKYLIRTTYYYGSFDNGSEPPVFDQIIGGTKWSTVNTSANFAQGLTSYYEIIVAAAGKTISVCLARNEHTVSSPFISALELEYLEDSMYNSTDFNEYALSTIARHRFGYDGQIMRYMPPVHVIILPNSLKDYIAVKKVRNRIVDANLNASKLSYPDDPFNRCWEPFTDANPVVETHSNVTSTDFWNLPPEKIFERALTTSRGKSLIVQWPPVSLPETSYYIALYFHDNRTPSPYSWRVFNVTINNQTFIAGLNVSTEGSMVYATLWPLSGKTQITLTPDGNSPVGPLINAGEVLLVLPLAGRTLTTDVIAMETLARSLNNRPSDWSGDPCLPQQHSWTGVVCSYGKLTQVISLNLTDYSLSGSLPRSMKNLTAITSILLGRNKLTGPIPSELGYLKELVYLHLEDNQFSGTIPASLGNLPKIQEIYLQNNNLQGEIPESLNRRSGLDIRISPGNQIN